MASKGPGPLPRRRESALAHGCGRGGRVVLPLARAAAVSTRSRLRSLSQTSIFSRGLPGIWSGVRVGLGLGLRVGLGIGLRMGLGLGLG